MQLNVTNRYLWLPVQTGNELQNVTIRQGDSKRFEMRIEAGGKPDFYAVLDLQNYTGQTLDIQGDCPEDWFELLTFQSTWPGSHDPKRPRLHFSAQIGWINDPNGLIYKDGIWHLYFQHNPFGIGWENMHWGHASSTDLIHWQQHEAAIYPDKNGVAFSGCAIEDTDNVTGFGKGTIVYYYSAVCAAKTWHADIRETQRMVISRDGGLTLEKTDDGIVEHIQGMNRDPKIFKFNDAFYMLLYLDETNFCLLKSANLKQWDKLQTWDLPKAWECPDLVYLPVIDQTGQDTGEHRWVFYSADGFYFFCEFDGQQLVFDQTLHEGFRSKTPYAAQTFSGVKDRTILQSWLRTPNNGSCYTGLMAVPVEMSLVRHDGRDALRIWPIAEFEGLRGSELSWEQMTLPDGRSQSKAFLNEDPSEWIIKTSTDFSGAIELSILGQKIHIDQDQKTIQFGEETIPWIGQNGFHGRFYIDYQVIECYLDNGLTYFAWPWTIDALAGELIVRTDNRTSLTQLEGYQLKI